MATKRRRRGAAEKRREERGYLALLKELRMSKGGAEKNRLIGDLARATFSS